MPFRFVFTRAVFFCLIELSYTISRSDEHSRKRHRFQYKLTAPTNVAVERSVAGLPPMLTVEGDFISMDRSKHVVSLWLVSILIATACGCQPQNVADQTADGQRTGNAAAPSDGVSADQIVTLMQAVYANAKNYRDDGVLLLSYRKDGLLTEEPQRWSTAWSADGKLAMEVFGAHLKGDGQRLSCYVYDIETANLDGQRMVVPYQNGQPPVTNVFRDPIARVFLGGYSELPLNEVDKTLREKLIPAPLSLLTGQLPCAWLQNAPEVERLADATLGKHECYVIRSLAEGLGCDIWIDKTSGLLLQMSLPLKLLDPQVMAAPNITDLRMLARFENASVNTAFDSETFQLQPRKNSTPVKSFVTLPQALPVESIGQVVDRFRLIQPDGKSVDHLHFDGKPTALLWLGGENSYDAIHLLTKLSEQLPANQFNFGIIYSDSELEGTSAQPHFVRPALTAAMASSDVPMFYDPGLAASIELAIRDIPSVVLLDEDSRVQFAASVVGDGWSNDLVTAIKRVAAGENLADEMLDQYQEFMTRYKSALARVDATALLPVNLKSIQRPMTNDTAASSAKLPARSEPPQIKPRRLWVAQDFKQAGNLSVRMNPVDDKWEMIVLDGWRSVVIVNEDGQIQARKELELPDKVAASKICTTKNGDQHAFYSPLSEHVYLFDKHFDPLTTLPTTPRNPPSPVTDVQLNLLSATNEGLLIATKDNGILGYESETWRESELKIAAAVHANSIASGPEHIAFVSGGKLRSISQSAPARNFMADMPLNFLSVYQTGRGSESTFIATSIDQYGNWHVVRVTPEMKFRSKVAIGPQAFNSAIDPVCSLTVETNTDSAHSLSQFAVATSANAVHIFSNTGKWLGDVKLSHPPRGVRLIMMKSAQPTILVTTENGLECWALE